MSYRDFCNDIPFMGYQTTVYSGKVLADGCTFAVMAGRPRRY